MPSLRDEIKSTIERRVRTASADELARIIIALTMDEMPPEVGAILAAPPDARFELAHDDQVVIDHNSGLMWSRAELTEDRREWADADRICRELDLAGFTDWRLPTIDELFALADRTRSEPAIGTRFFPDCKSAWYWSSTPYAPSPGGCAWGVGFGNGSADWYYRSYNGFVRAVRASQLSAL